MTDKHQPSEQEIVEACSALLAEFPSLGIAKILSNLQNEKNWSLSEKRLKNSLAKAGLRSSSTTNATSKSPEIPSSSIDALLAIPPGVKAVYFDKVKGKGLVASRDFQEGEPIFTEDAFIAAPPAHALLDVESGQLCTHCFAPLSSLLVISCDKSGCQARFCNRLCQSRAQGVHHALLCPGQNTSIKPFNSYLSTQKWLSLNIVARSIARIVITRSEFAPPSIASSSAQSTTKKTSPTATLEETLKHFDAFATVSELERRARNPGWEVEKQSFLSAMKEGHRLICEGMDPRRERKGKWPIRDQLPEQVAESLFSWESFIRMLGRSNLNAEAQGGMYLVHSHLNHSCAPNVATTHPPSRAGVRQATKIMAVARRAIKAGEELFITYQDPRLSLARRRMLLWREYMFGPCQCERCLDDERHLSDVERKEMKEGSWKKDEKEEEEYKKRKDHAEMLDKMEKERDDKLRREGKSVPEKDLTGLEDELRAKLGF
ncbi:hypothetical protein CBS101457_002464 [Exobasidium rhododendri]|nr:hypothetical protein CBS101457_002464 [Exobasidium rhododendri]